MSARGYAGFRPPLQYPVPAQDRVGRDETGHVHEALPAERLAFDCQATPLVIGKAETPVAELFAEDAVLGLEVVDHVLLVAVDPAGDEQDEELEGGCHSAGG